MAVLSKSVIYLSYGIPVFYFDAPSGMSEVTVQRGGATVFSTRLYAVNGRTALYDLKEVIEQDMREGYLTLALYTLYLDGEVYAEFYVLYCSMRFRGNHYTFIENRFLTMQTAKQMAREKDELYYLESLSIEVAALRMRVTYRDGEGRVLVHEEEETPRRSAARVEARAQKFYFMYVVMVEPQRFEHLGTVLAITTSVGKRSFTHYYVEEQPSLKVVFLNLFNVPELLHIIGVTVRKAEVERSEAVLRDETAFYDQSCRDVVEFESAPMTREAAEAVRQMVAAHQVHIVNTTYDDFDDLPGILITDHTVEVSDKKGAMNSVKLTFRYAQGRLQLPEYKEPESPFNEVYSLPYL